MWRELVSEFPEAELHDPTARDALATLEGQLGQRLPDSLRELLTEANGIEADYGVETVWTTEKNPRREPAIPPQHRISQSAFEVLLFRRQGGGDQFAFVRTPARDDFFVWDHETDSRTWVAPSLKGYLRSALASGGEDWYR
jgi:SMI1-KNR4 cell-wall